MILLHVTSGHKDLILTYGHPSLLWSQGHIYSCVRVCAKVWILSDYTLIDYSRNFITEAAGKHGFAKESS